MNVRHAKGAPPRARCSASPPRRVLAAAELVEQIVARVNDRLITQSRVRQPARRSPRRPRNHPTDLAELQKDVLEDLIREKLLEERAKEMSVSATDEEVENAVARVKQQYNLATDAEFDAALAQSGMTRDELKRQMRETITLQKVIGRDVTSKLDLSDDALRAEYERRKEQFYAIPESAHVAEIVRKFSPSDAEARQQAVARIEEIQRQDQGRRGLRRPRQGVLGGHHAATGAATSASSTRASSSRPWTRRSSSTPAAGIPGAGAAARLDPPLPRHRPQGRRVQAVRRGQGRPAQADLRRLYEKRFTEYMDKLRREAFVKIYDPELAKLDEKKARASPPPLRAPAASACLRLLLRRASCARTAGTTCRRSPTTPGAAR